MALYTCDLKIAILESLLENFPVPFFTVDRDLVIDYMNEPMERLSGFAREEVIGRMACALVLSTPECNTPDCLLRMSMRCKKPIAGVRKTVKNSRGDKIPVVVNASIITDQSGGVIGGFEIFQDITFLVKAQQEVEQTRRQLIHSAKMTSIGRLIARVTHELNNPLSGIVSCGDLLMREMGKDHRWRSDLEQMMSSALRCSDIVSKLLAFSRKPEGQGDWININEILARSIQAFASHVICRNMKIVQDFQGDLPLIRGNSQDFEQVFANLIVNARDAMDGGGVLTIFTKFDFQNQQVIITFADTGHGMSDEVMDKIFEPFFTTKQVGKGTGLGLYIVHEIVLQHGGAIDVKSKPSVGTTFTVSLPVEFPDNPKARNNVSWGEIDRQ